MCFDTAERIRHNALREGLVLLTSRNCIRLCPPLTITDDQLDEAVGRLTAALVRTEQGEPKGLDLARAYDRSSSLAHRRGSTRVR